MGALILLRRGVLASLLDASLNKASVSWGHPFIFSKIWLFVSDSMTITMLGWEVHLEGGICLVAPVLHYWEKEHTEAVLYTYGMTCSLTCFSLLPSSRRLLSSFVSLPFLQTSTSIAPFAKCKIQTSNVSKEGMWNIWIGGNKITPRGSRAKSSGTKETLNSNNCLWESQLSRTFMISLIGSGQSWQAKSNWWRLSLSPRGWYEAYSKSYLDTFYSIKAYPNPLVPS